MFSPSLKVLRWVGATEERESVKKSIVQHILAQPRTQWSDPDVNFDVLITTYDFAIKDKDFFARFIWRALVVDEAHRLKNAASKLFGALQDLRRERVLLLTGTPIQNSLQELFALLHFLMPNLFADANIFLQHFKPLAKGGGGNGKVRLIRLPSRSLNFLVTVAGRTTAQDVETVLVAERARSGATRSSSQKRIHHLHATVASATGILPLNPEERCFRCSKG